MATITGMARVERMITGLAPLIMHDIHKLGDPMHPLTKEIKSYTGKRTKTDEDQIEIARLEFMASLYLDEKDQVIIPGENFEAMLAASFSKTVKGGKKVAQSGLFCDDAVLVYGKKRTPAGLWEDKAFRLNAPVRVQQARVMRMRPWFRSWSARVVVNFMPDVINEDQIVRALEYGGRCIGIGDWRPKHGRFLVESA